MGPRPPPDEPTLGEPWCTRVSLMPSLTMQMAGGWVVWGVVRLAPLLVYCSVQGRCGNEKTHGVLDVPSRQATKTNHRTTIGSREAPDPEQTLFARRAKAVGHDGRTPMPKYEFMCENCRKTFEVMLTAAERAVAKVACPTCGGGEVTPQMAIFTAKTSRKS